MTGVFDLRPIFLHMNLQTQPNNLILFFLWRFVLCDAQKNTRTVLEHFERDLLEWCSFFRAKLQDPVCSSFSQEISKTQAKIVLAWVLEISFVNRSKFSFFIFLKIFKIKFLHEKIIFFVRIFFEHLFCGPNKLIIGVLRLGHQISKYGQLFRKNVR